MLNFAQKKRHIFASASGDFVPQTLTRSHITLAYAHMPSASLSNDAIRIGATLSVFSLVEWDYLILFNCAFSTSALYCAFKNNIIK